MSLRFSVSTSEAVATDGATATKHVEVEGAVLRAEEIGIKRFRDLDDGRDTALGDVVEADSHSAHRIDTVPDERNTAGHSPQRTVGIRSGLGCGRLSSRSVTAAPLLSPSAISRRRVLACSAASSRAPLALKA